MPQISVDEAREYFKHPSQQLYGMTEWDIPEDVEYWAVGPICGVFHQGPWEGVWMSHHAVKPERWGLLDTPAVEGLNEFWNAKEPELIMGWTPKHNRLAVAFARRIGFKRLGEFPTSLGDVVMQGWSK